MARAPKKSAAKADKTSGNLTHDNSKNVLTEDQRQVLFFEHMRKISALKDKLGTVNSDLRNAYKLAKAEGFPKKDFDFAFMLERDEDDGAIERRRREAEIAKWLGHPIGTQADLFEGTSIDKRPIAETSYEDGKRAGIRNEVLRPPHGAGTEAYDRYVAGWHDGNAARLNTVKEQEEGASLLRMDAPAASEPDEFDDAAEGNEPPDEDAGDPLGDGEQQWPDDAQVAAHAEEREPAEAL